MDNTVLLEDQWEYVLNMLPSDLEQSAAEKLALVRRREIGCAGDLLRLALCYGLCDFSLRQTAAWAKLIGLGEMSNVAVLNRLRGASDWLGHLILRWLQDHGLTTKAPRRRVRLLDASVISKPGSKGTDWRLHLGLDLAELRITSVELTGPEGGETLSRHEFAPGEIVVGDRGYAQRAGVASVLEQEAHVLIRLNWQNFPLETPSAASLDLLESLELLEPGEIGDWQVQFRANRHVYPVRLVALRKSRAAAEKEQKRIRHEATRKGRKPNPNSMRAAHFIYLITDLSSGALPAAEALELYRLRWQIEIAFKRLKGIVHLDKLRAKDTALARTYLYAKMLGALIVDHFFHDALDFFPWGYPIFPHSAQPLARAADTC